MKRFFILPLVFVCGLILTGCQQQLNLAAESEQTSVVSDKLATVVIGDQSFTMELAQTAAERQQGLSGRDEIGSDGVVFIFDVPGKHPFWMKDMKFALDFLWVSDGEIVEISRNIPPTSGTSAIPTVAPNQSVDQVIEVNSGFVIEHGIMVGDQVVISQ